MNLGLLTEPALALGRDLLELLARLLFGSCGIRRGVIVHDSVGGLEVADVLAFEDVASAATTGVLSSVALATKDTARLLCQF